MKLSPSFYLLSALCGILYSANAADEPPAQQPTTKNPALAGDGVQVGIARRDGITVTGGEVFVTRNGATEKLVKELQLPSGVSVRPDGTITLGDNTTAILRSTQLLTFEGKLMEVPMDPNVNPAPPQAKVSPVVGGTAANPTSAGSGQPAMQNIDGRAGALSNSAGSVFLGADGLPFMGTLNANGTIVTADGRTITADLSIRAVTFGTDGTPALGTVNANGTITRADGASVLQDGSVRAANGVLISPPRTPNAGNNQNTTPSNGAGTGANRAGQKANQPNQNIPGAGAGPNTRSGTQQTETNGAGARSGGAAGGGNSGAGAGGASSGGDAK